MNPWDLSASDLLVWGIVSHLIADWPLQNDWMATKKAKLAHPAGIVHAAIHGLALGLVFGAVPGVVLALAHYVIDLRFPVAWWSQFVRQTQPTGRDLPMVDIGLTVRFWTDQVFHIACIAVAALLVSTGGIG